MGCDPSYQLSCPLEQGFRRQLRIPKLMCLSHGELFLLDPLGDPHQSGQPLSLGGLLLRADHGAFHGLGRVALNSPGLHIRFDHRLEALGSSLLLRTVQEQTAKHGAGVTLLRNSVTRSLEPRSVVAQRCFPGNVSYHSHLELVSHSRVIGDDITGVAGSLPKLLDPLAVAETRESRRPDVHLTDQPMLLLDPAPDLCHPAHTAQPDLQLLANGFQVFTEVRLPDGGQYRIPGRLLTFVAGELRAWANREGLLVVRDFFVPIGHQSHAGCPLIHTPGCFQIWDYIEMRMGQPGRVLRLGWVKPVQIGQGCCFLLGGGQRHGPLFL